MGIKTTAIVSNNGKRPASNSEGVIIEENDCGFRFKRLSKVSPLSSTTTTLITPSSLKLSNNHEPLATTRQQSQLKEESKTMVVAGGETKIGKNNNSTIVATNLDSKKSRRRSSFAAIAARSTPRTSSFSVSLSTKLPPKNVNSKDYYKHLMPDLPGPVKMRQLLIWATLKAATTNNSSLKAAMAEDLVQALFTNKINTSWYSRPSTGPTATENDNDQTSNQHKTLIPSTTATRGPKNQELIDCIQLYERYQEKLKIEMKEWQTIKERSSKINIATVPINTKLDDIPTGIARDRIKKAGEWLEKLPKPIDQLGWSVSVAQAFELHAHTYCESVFHQIRTRLFGDGERPNPMLLMRALVAGTTATTTVAEP